MSSKRKRRRSGHPAKIAGRRSGSSRKRRSDPDEAFPQRAIETMCREADGLTGPFEAELWASGLLGVLWSQRYGLLPAHSPDDYDRVYGEPLCRSIARRGGRGALMALKAIEAVDDREVGSQAAKALRQVGGSVDLPEWVDAIGEASFERAAVMREDVYDDGFTVFIEAAHPGSQRQAVGVYIDNNLGVMAKDILLADSIEQVRQVMADNPETHDSQLKIEPIDPGHAGGHIYAAIDLTDETFEPPVAEDYSRFRALALLRADELPGPSVDPERFDVDPEERDRLRDEFLASPHGQGFEPDGDEAYVASLAIDFCSDYVDGRPLRWSPVVVELFMANWIPRKVLAEPPLLERLPDALKAWIRFAGRKRGLEDSAVRETCDAVERWPHEMVEKAGDPEAAGPAKEFLVAAKEAGIDLADDEALQAFIAGWSAHN